ncbi:MAG: ATP-binding protein [Actinomycetota bacterium]|nr:ATP-binding protein [Actinomycetota bacterium]
MSCPLPKSREGAFFHAVAHTLAIVIKHARLEAEQQKLLAQLSQAEKYAELGRISASVAHEIRNPLTVVGGFARMLQKRIADKTEREYADFIVSEVSKLEEILRDILSYSRTTALKLQEYSIHYLIEDILKIYEDQFKEHQIMVQKSYDFSGNIKIDKLRAREVIINVISNAIDSMQEGGILTVNTALEDVHGESFVAVRIGDTGIGITPEHLGKVFEPFFTTKIYRKGVGLGLAISKKIMADHGGFITVESTPGKGATFILHFPKGQAALK